MTANTGDDPLIDLLAGIEPERNRYFTGRYLTAGDFATEQAHILDQARLTRRLALGWGIAAGLEVTPHPDPGCLDCLLVGPGLAIDAAGRFLILREARLVGLGDLVPPLALVARYAELPVLPVPVLAGTGAAALDRLEPARTREDIELRLTALDGRGAPPAGDVVLAVIRLGAGQPAKPEVDGSGRRPLAAAATPLPILAMSWNHGKPRAAELVKAGGLWLRFARPLASEVDGEIFEVSLRGKDGVAHRLTPLSGHPQLFDDGRAVMFRVKPDAELPPGATLLIRLRCDFLVDSAGQAVSGRFIGGRLPTGGEGGGVFESWFTIKDGSESEGAQS